MDGLILHDGDKKLTSLTVSPCVAHRAGTAVVIPLMTRTDASVPTRLQYTWIIY